MAKTQEPEGEPESRPLCALPEFDPELVERCRDRGEPIKHVALLAIDVGATSLKQPAQPRR